MSYLQSNNPSKIAKDTVDLVASLKNNNNIVTASGIVPRLDKLNSSGKWSYPGHFLKAQGKFLMSFLCTLFYIFLTPKNLP